jgi:hypothetical protein
MQGDDVFDKTKPWQQVLLKYCLDELSKNDDYRVKSLSDLSDTPLETARWGFQKEGLRIRFQPYEIAAYAFGSPVVVVPWNVLGKYLVADPPLANEQLESGIK